MNDKQTRKYNMANTVAEVLIDNKTEWEKTPAFVRKETALEDSIGSIEEHQTGQETDITGNAKDKKAKKEEMANASIAIAKPLATFAKDDKNKKVLLNEIDFELSDLLKVKDVTARDRCQLVHDRADANIAALADYNILPDMLKAQQTAIDAFQNSMSAPRKAQTDRETATQELAKAFTGLDEVLDALDSLMRPYETKNSEFFGKYTAARDILDSGNRIVTIRGLVTDAANGSPIIGATVTVKGSNVKTNSGSTGKYRIFSLAPATYTLIVTKKGFADKTVENVMVKDGVITDVDVQMSK